MDVIDYGERYQNCQGFCLSIQCFGGFKNTENVNGIFLYIR